MRSNKAPLYFWTFILSAIIVFLVTTTFTAYLKNIKLKRYAHKLQQDCTALTDANKKMSCEVAALTKDPAYLEILMRQEMKMAGPNELVIKRQN